MMGHPHNMVESVLPGDTEPNPSYTRSEFCDLQYGILTEP